MDTIGQKLDNYEKRFVWSLTAAKIKEPLVRALYWKRGMWNAADELAGVGPDPSAERDLWFDEHAIMRDHWRDLVTSLWLARIASRPRPLAEGKAA